MLTVSLFGRSIISGIWLFWGGFYWLTSLGNVGAAGGVGAALTGDREKQEKYQQMHDDAKTQLRSAQADIQKQGEAEAKARQ